MTEATPRVASKKRPARRTLLRRLAALPLGHGLAGAGTALLALGGASAAAPARAAEGPAARPPARAARPAPLALGQPVPWPARIDLLDRPALRAEALAGQAVVLVFWASYCPFCRRHNPHVQALHRAAAGLPLQVLSASFDDAAGARAYLGRQGHDFPVTLDAARLAPLFSTRDVLPLTVVIDRRGRLREVIPGEMFAEDVAALIKYAQADA